MKDIRSKKVLIIGVLVLIILVVVIGSAIFSVEWDEVFYTTKIEENEIVDEKYSSVDELKNNALYVWHNKGTNLKSDLEDGLKNPSFLACPMGDVPESDTNINNIWFMGETDEVIPTLYEGDRLIYVSRMEPLTNMLLKKYADNGYTLGISNMVSDASGHFFIPMYDENAEVLYKKSIAPKSDAMSITEIDSVYHLYLDKVGDMQINEESVSDGGSVLGLSKGKAYKCEFYTGTYYQDYKLSADVRNFHLLESFEFCDYDFAHSNFILINLPEYMISGYYSLNNLGVFRYVCDEDKHLYNGEAYSSLIDWNKTVKRYDESGACIYDPTKPQNMTENAPKEDKKKAEAVEITTKSFGFDYDCKTPQFKCFVVCTSSDLKNSDRSVMIVTRPNGTQKELIETSDGFVYIDDAAIEGQYHFEITNMQGRSATVSYTTNKTK